MIHNPDLTDDATGDPNDPDGWTDAELAADAWADAHAEDYGMRY